MSVECSECERDLRTGHDPSCSRHQVRKRIQSAISFWTAKKATELAKRNAAEYGTNEYNDARVDCALATGAVIALESILVNL